MNIDVIAFEYVNLRKGNKSSLHCTYLRCSPKSSKVSFDGDSNTGYPSEMRFPETKDYIKITIIQVSLVCSSHHLWSREEGVQLYCG